MWLILQLPEGRHAYGQIGSSPAAWNKIDHRITILLPHTGYAVLSGWYCSGHTPMHVPPSELPSQKV